METLVLLSQSVWLIAAAGVLLLFGCALAVEALLRKLMVVRLKRLLARPAEYGSVFARQYSPRALLFRSSVLEKFARRHGPEILRLTGIDELWIQRLAEKRKKADFLRVLKYSREKGLFSCFLVSLEQKSLAPLLIQYLESTGEFLYMRRLALAGKGEQFDGANARKIFSHQLPLIREMTGDPEWASRYFAVKILVHDPEEKSVRAVWDSFRDAHALVRKTVAEECETKEDDRLFEALHTLVLGDPVFEVRKAAHVRITREFKDRYRPDPAALSPREMWHVLGLLRDGDKDDENFAMTFLAGSDLEMRQMAALYLDKNGVLTRLCRRVDLGDREDFEKKRGLLANACEVNASTFLSIVKTTHDPAGLLLCARLLAGGGDPALITTLAEKVFAIQGINEIRPELYQAVLECVSTRGDEISLLLMEREMFRRRHDAKIMALLLPLIPARSDNIFVKPLISLLKTEGFQPDEPLRDALKRMPHAQVLPEVLEILHADRSKHAHSVRIAALKLLGEMNLPYCTNTVLENLPMLPVDQAKDFGRTLASYPKETLLSNLLEMLGTVDARLRASLLAVLPSTGEVSFLKEVHKCMKDADPDVRIASVWALVDYEDLKSLSEAVSMLRDPVERVRSEVGRVLGAHGSEKVLRELHAILWDDDEMAAVKSAVIGGLAASESLVAVDILVERLEVDELLVPDIVNALAHRTEKKEVLRIIEVFKDALPNFRERIAHVFKQMGDRGEKQLADLLREDISSLNPYVVDILEATGHIESNIRRLSHRDPSVRKAAAEFLSLVGTRSAFRGIVLAARDPDEDVRVMVIRALEKLEKKDGKELLSSLESDPDRRVRKYTHWALERLHAKAL